MTPFQIVIALRAILEARKGLRLMQSAFQVLKVLAEIGQHFPKVGARIAEAMADGHLGDNDDVEKFAMDLAHTIELKVNVGGVDVIDERAEEHLLAFIGVVTANAIRAKQA